MILTMWLCLLHFQAETKKGYDKFLLAFSLFNVETSQDLDNHLEFVKFVLSAFQNSLEYIVFCRGELFY